MNEKMMKLLEKKKKSGMGMSDAEKDAKMSVIKDMQDMAKNAMGDKLSGLKKVTVTSDSPEGLQKGLEKAKEILPKDDESSDEEESSHDAMDELENSGEEKMESSEDELHEIAQELDHLDEADLDKLAKLIEMKKASKKSDIV